jgi:hypothetical protein
MHTFAALQMDHGASSFVIAIVITSACCMEGILDCDLYSDSDKELIMWVWNQMLVGLPLSIFCFVAGYVWCSAFSCAAV